jgi:hypothetical protein
VGRIQERYGIQKDEAERQVDDWNKTLGHDNAELERENLERDNLRKVS